MKLFVDVGNTALKWRRRDANNVEQGGAAHFRDWPRALETSLSAGRQQFKAIWVVSVAGVDADYRIGELIEERTGVRPQFYYSRSSDFGVRNCYSDPRRLGADRWVALVECWQRFGAGIIIDCGSALTIDAVDGQGNFLGGYIVPGLGMLRTALLRDTSDVHVGRASPRMELGQSTGECVQNGLLRMLVAFVSDTVVELRERLPDTCRVLMTGGDASELCSAFSFEFTCLPDLVLDGLERIAADKI